MTEDHVSFEVAKLLKEKGFNGLCTAYYDCFTTENFHCGNEPTDFNSIDTKIRNIVAAPTLQMTMKWLREVHKIEVRSTYDWDKNTWWGQTVPMFDENDSNSEMFQTALGFDYPGKSYEESCEAGIKHCLKVLI